MNDAPLLIDLDDGVLTLTNNHAPHNRMTFEYMDALEAAVSEAADDPAVRAARVHRSRRRALLGRHGPQAAHDRRRRREAARKRSSTSASGCSPPSRTSGKPSIVTLFGYCLGGGLELPLACHFRLAASEGARIGLPELDLGHGSGMGRHGPAHPVRRS